MPDPRRLVVRTVKGLMRQGVTEFYAAREVEGAARRAYELLILAGFTDVQWLAQIIEYAHVIAYSHHGLSAYEDGGDEG